MLRVRVTVRAEEMRLSGMMARMQDLAPVLASQAQLLETMIRKDVFGGEQAPDGSPWEPLAETTVARRRRGKKKGRRIVKPLQDTRELYQSIGARAGKTSLFFGLYAKGGMGGNLRMKLDVHQYGTRHVPARPFLPLLPDGTPYFGDGPAAKWHARMVERVQRYIATGRL